jgi:hypothetical protein
MLESIPVRRYQTVDQVLQDLKEGQQLPSTPVSEPVKPVTSSPPTSTPVSINKTTSQIDIELEEMKTLFLQGGNSKSNKKTEFQPQPQTPQPSSSQSEIDAELEELKAKYKNGEF